MRCSVDGVWHILGGFLWSWVLGLVGAVTRERVSYKRGEEALFVFGSIMFTVFLGVYGPIVYPRSSGPVGHRVFVDSGAKM